MPQSIKIPKKKGEKTRKFLREHNLLNLEYKIDKDQTHLYFPLKRELNEKEEKKLKKITKKHEKITEHSFEKKKQKPKNLKDALRKELSNKELKDVPSSFDVLGDIAIIELPQTLIDKKESIGKALMQVHKNLNTVLLQKSPVSGEYRVKDVEVIAGENKTHTIHKEHGCRFHIDLSKVFYSPRLSREREVVTKQVEPREVVFDMFAGVGPFSIMIAKKKQPKKIYAVDKNKEAIELLEKNKEINNVKQKIEPIQGDIREIAPKYKNSSDRAIMNLPFKSGSFLEEAITLLKQKGGIIHYYDIRDEENLFKGAIKDIKQKSKEMSYSIEVLDERVVRSYSPKTWNIAIDVKLTLTK